MDQRKKCGVEVDRISLLPDELVVHILSSLPSKTSASTSILSRRWLHLWKHTTKLIFRSDGSAEFVNWVNSVLKSHRATSLQEFTVDFFANKSNLHDVAKWLEFAFSRRVETLSLNFNGVWHTRFYEPPRFEEIITLLVPTNTMRSLKVLRLLEIKINGDAIKFFLGNCPVLEELYIIRAAVTSDVDLVGPSLRYLEVEPNIIKNKFFIKVSAPKLTRLRVGLDTNHIVLENVPKLVDMVFRCYADATMHGFSAAASQLKTLSISIYIDYNDPKPSFMIPEIPKLKSLVVDNYYHDYPPSAIVPLPVISFLKASPCLQEFHVKFVRLALEEGETDQGCRTVFRHSCLKRFNLLYCGRSSPHDNDCTKLDCIKLVRCVVESCVALEEIEISQCDYGTKLEEWDYIPVDDVCVRAATTAERTQLQLPAHIKLRIVNHSHKRA